VLIVITDLTGSSIGTFDLMGAKHRYPPGMQTAPSGPLPLKHSFFTRVPGAVRLGRIVGLNVSAVLLIATMALSNFVQLLTSPLLFLSRPLFYKLNSFLAGTAWGICQHMFEVQNGVKVHVSGLERVPFHESALVISNHCSFLDWVMVHAVSQKRGMLGNCRYFAKDSIKYMPFFGWGMYLAGFIFLKRNWAKDQRHINATFETMTKYRLPVHLISFVEGSRVNPKKLEQSHAYAQQHNLPILNYTLLPRSKGFTASVLGLRNSHIEHIYDLTVAFYHYRRGFGVTPSLSDYLLGRLNEYQFHVHVDRHAMKELPQSEADIAKWLVKLYERKNERIAKIKASWEAQYPTTRK
jgi:1-acyl-sn-glycerol-3-phosphate acyltransferase